MVLIPKVHQFPQYSPKIMHAQELLFASAKPRLLAATCRTLALESCKPQELLCGLKLETARTALR